MLLYLNYSSISIPPASYCKNSSESFSNFVNLNGKTKQRIKLDSTQIFLLVIIALIVGLRIKKHFAMKSMNNYSVSEVKQLLKENNIVLLDVRTTGERNSGSIKPSIHIPLHEIASRIDELTKYKSREIICYCQSGSRSVSAAIKLKKLGFKASNMLGGYSSW
jgi:rhodanese-related sulfurtransferase